MFTIMDSDEIIERLKNSIIEGEENDAMEAAKAAVASDIDPQLLIKEGLIKGSEEVGRLYETKEYFLTELILAADAMTSAMNVLQPLMQKSKLKSGKKILLGTVQGDMHNIGKNIVKSLLLGRGYEIIDLGIDVLPEKFAEAAKLHKPDIIGLGALLTVAISKMHETIIALKEANISSKIIIGGGIVSGETCDKIGADAWTKDAYDGVKKIEELLRGDKSNAI